jgi:hypothetical protein
VTTDYLLGRADYNYRNKTEENISSAMPIGVQSVLDLDTDKLKRDLDSSDNEGQKLKFLFDEPLQSYAMWLRNAGISISGGGISGMVVVEIEDDEFFDISGNMNAILQMSKEHFKMLVRQLGERWPQK